MNDADIAIINFRTVYKGMVRSSFWHRAALNNEDRDKRQACACTIIRSRKSGQAIFALRSLRHRNYTVFFLLQNWELSRIFIFHDNHMNYSHLYIVITQASQALSKFSILRNNEHSYPEDACTAIRTWRPFITANPKRYHSQRTWNLSKRKV